jgi:subfamily B ATP-binding cassette protein MsbA
MLKLLSLGRRHRPLLGAAFVCMAIVGLTTGAYAFLMGPALRFLLTGGMEGLAPVLSLAPSLEAWPRDRLLLALPVTVVVVGAVKGAGYLGQFYFVGLFGQQVARDVRRRLFERVLALSPGQRARLLSGELLSRFTADVAAVEQAATYTIASWLRDTLQIAILAAVAVALSWKLSLLTLIAVPVAILPASRLTRALMARAREGQAALGAMAGQVQEGLGALKAIQAFNAEHAESQRFERRTQQAQTALSRAGWARAAVPGVMEVLASLAIAGTLGWAASTQAVPPEALVSFLGAVVLLYQPAKDLGRVSQFAIAAGVALERLEAIWSLPVRVPVGGAGLATLGGGLELESVSFRWEARDVLREVSLRVEAGKVTALVGESGSGKSTLVSMLLRFEVPEHGAYRIDGHDVTGLTLESVRGLFALVTQESLLFSATVRENVRVGRPEATTAEIEAACRTANAWDFITALPNGLDTPIGERGVTLSGGQRQRLALARALVSKAPVLVLDEATSNLDPESERDVQRALDEALPGWTAVVISHRLEAIRSADRIVVLHEGTVVEQGTHAELVATRGRYAQLWAAQHQGAETSS